MLICQIEASLLLFVNLMQTRVTWEEGLNWGITQVRFACRCVYGELSHCGQHHSLDMWSWTLQVLSLNMNLQASKHVHSLVVLFQVPVCTEILPWFLSMRDYVWEM